MREDELRKHAKCSHCGKGIGHAKIPFFWTLTVNRYCLDMQALQRNAGLVSFFLGSALLAKTMGPDENMAKKIMKPVTLTLCENCAMEPVIIPVLCEEAGDDEPEEVEHESN